MRLLYFSSSRIPSTEANSIQVLRMAEAFANRGLDVEVFASYGDKQGSQDVFSTYGVQGRFKLIYVRRLKIKRLGSFIYGLCASIKGRSWNADIVYARCPHSLYWASKYNKPFIYEAHDLPNGRLRHTLEKSLFLRRNFTKLVVISDALRKDYLKNFEELSPAKVVVAHDGANVPPEAWASSFCTPSYRLGSGLEVGYLGSVYPGKGVEGVLALAKKKPFDNFHVVGGTSEELVTWRSQAPNNVNFHGRIEPSKTYSKLREFDVLLLSAQRKIAASGGGDIARYTSPLKMFEYMAAGRPIIASSIDVLKEVLQHRKNSLLVAPDDTAGWSEALEELRVDKALSRNIAKNALDDLTNKYTWKARAEKVLCGLHRT